MRAKLLLFPMLVSVSLLAGISLLAAVSAAWDGRVSQPVTASDLSTEYPVPLAEGNPLNLALESAGGPVWFTMPDANAIGRLVVTSTVEFQFTQFDVPTPDSRPYDLALDGEALWFTEMEADQIGRLDMITGDILEFAIPLSPTISITDSSPAGISVSPSGDVWFAERAANSIGRFDPETSTFDRFVYSDNGALPEEIIAKNDETIWFTAPGLDRVIQYLVNIDKFLSVPVNLGPNTPLFSPGGIVLDDSGSLWAGGPEMDMIGIYFPGTLSLWHWYRVPGPGTGPTAIAHSRDVATGTDTLWYAGSEGGVAGALTINSAGNVVRQGQLGLSAAGALPTDIAVDTEDVVWIADYGGNMIVAWFPPYSFDVYLPAITK